MGCDIHMCVEVIRNGKWVNADKWTPNKYYTPDEEDSSEKPTAIDYDNRVYTGRNYALFGILTGGQVRWGYDDVAGQVEYQLFDEPRGSPDDVDPITNADIGESSDYHSLSWLMLKELQEFNWDQIIMAEDVVSLKAFCDFKNTGKYSESSWRYGDEISLAIAEEYYEMIHSPNTKKSYRTAVRALIQAKTKPDHIAVPVSVPTTLKRLSGHFLVPAIPWRKDGSPVPRNEQIGTLPLLLEIQKEHEVEADELRLVFSFDN